MNTKLKETSEEFKSGYSVGLSVSRNNLNQPNLSEACANATIPYRKEGKSEDFIYGMETAISEVVNEFSRQVYGPRERGMKGRRW